MTSRLHQHGFSVAGFDIRPYSTLTANTDSIPPFPLLESLKTLSWHQVLWAVVRNEQDINDLCFDQQAVYQQAQYPLTLVISSTVSPGFIHSLRKQLPDKVRLIDAPMSGAPYSAKAGALTFMVGGSTDSIQSIKPYLTAMGSQIHHIGPTGSGMLVKVMNNYVAATSVVAVRRSLSRAARLGIDPAELLNIMSQSSGATWYGDHADDIEWARQSYDAQNTIGILEKDVQCSLSADHVTPDGFDEALLLALKQLPEWPEGKG